MSVMPRDQLLHIRISEIDKQAVIAEAEAEMRSQSDMVRVLIREALAARQNKRNTT